jgi:hypothetical protein
MSVESAYDVAHDPKARKAFEECMKEIAVLMTKYEDPSEFAYAVSYVGIGIISSVLSMANTTEDARKLKDELVRTTEQALEACLTTMEDPEAFAASQNFIIQ